ncbi:MAG TPA: cbb3-type cytochrome oxidase assembly protein CcoS [Noviherbaspirillum sp.]
MEVLYILVPVSIVIVFIAIWIFFRASDSGQFDDLVGPGMRILQDDDRVRDESRSDKNTGTASDKNR